MDLPSWLKPNSQEFEKKESNVNTEPQNSVESLQSNNIGEVITPQDIDSSNVPENKSSTEEFTTVENKAVNNSSEVQDDMGASVPQAVDESKIESKSDDSGVKESLSGLQEVIDNIQYNVSILVQNQASASDVAALRRENEAFRSDSNMKLMRKYGIDAMIKTYQAICDKLFRINHPHEDGKNLEGEKSAYEWVLNRMGRQFKQLGIRLQRTEMGSPFNEETMVVYGSDGEDVDDEETMFDTETEELKDTVKESVSPAFFWTIPSLIGNTKEWCMEPEKVCIYK